MDSRAPVEEPAGSQGRPELWPIRSGMPPPLADGFITRLESAPELRTALTPGAMIALVPDRAAAAAPLDWRGACGKTQLAVGLAESLWQSREVDLLVWITAASRASVLSGYLEAARATIGTGHTLSAEAAAGRFVSWLGETTRSWLVVLDDLSDVADLDGLWPKGPAGAVLITATNLATLSGLSGERQPLVRPVGTFSRREALSYLMGRLTADTGQRLGAIDLIKDLGCEPMALAQASSVIASSALSCHEYREYLASRVEQLARPSGGALAAAAVTWTLSVEHAERLWQGGDAQPWLALAAVLDGHGIPAEIFTTSAARDLLASDGAGGRVHRGRAEAVLLILERTGLLVVDQAGTPPMVQLSSVVQAAVRAALTDRMRDRTVRAAADALLQVWRGDEPRSALEAALRSCAASLEQHAAGLLWAGGCHPLLLRAGRSLDAAGLTGPAAAYWRKLAAASGQILGQGHPDTLVIAKHLADAYLTAGQAAEAIPWYQWVLATRVRALGPDDPGTIAARGDLGRALLADNQLRDAIAMLDGILCDYERLAGADHPDTLAARDELAAAYHAAAEFAVVIRLSQRTLADRERTQGARHPAALTTREKLADGYLADGRVKDALSEYKRVLADREDVLGTDHPDTIAARGNLGSAYHTAGRMASALRFYEQACEGYGRVLGPDHPDTLARRASLAHAYYAAGRITDATMLLRDTAARCERVLPPGDPLMQAVQDSLRTIAG